MFTVPARWLACGVALAYAGTAAADDPFAPVADPADVPAAVSAADFAALVDRLDRAEAEVDALRTRLLDPAPPWEVPPPFDPPAVSPDAAAPVGSPFRPVAFQDVSPSDRGVADQALVTPSERAAPTPSPPTNNPPSSRRRASRAIPSREPPSLQDGGASWPASIAPSGRPRRPPPSGKGLADFRRGRREVAGINTHPRAAAEVQLQPVPGILRVVIERYVTDLRVVDPLRPAWRYDLTAVGEVILVQGHARRVPRPQPKGVREPDGGKRNERPHERRGMHIAVRQPGRGERRAENEHAAHRRGDCVRQRLGVDSIGRHDGDCPAGAAFRITPR